MPSIESKDYIILVYGFLLSIPAGLIVFWLSSITSRLFDSRSKRIRLGRLKAEQDRLKHVTALVHSNLLSAYATVECTYSLGRFVSGVVIMAVAFGIMILNALLFRHEQGIPIASISAWLLMISGAAGVVSGWRKYARLCGDLARAMKYKDYKASVDKLTQELSVKSTMP